MMRSTRRRPERGSMTPMVAFGTIVVTVMGIGAATIGRMVHARREAQNAADAAALAAADLVREEGLTADRSGAVAMGQRNSAVATQVAIDGIDDRTLQVDARAHAVQTVDTPRFIFNGDGNVRGKAVATISQEIRTIAASNTGDVVFVLDYSGSMAGTRIKTLEEAVSGHLLDQRIPLNYSAALFSLGLVAAVPFGDDAVTKILDEFARQDAFGNTHPEFGFDKAREFFREQPKDGPPRYVVFVSDGEPTEPPKAFEGSRKLWDEAGPTVMTIHIGSGESSNFMIAVSGTPQDRGNRDFYFPVTSNDEFRNALAQVVSRIACPIEGLTKARVKDPSTVRGFLRDATGREIKIPRRPNVEDAKKEDLGFFYDEKSAKLAVTIATCIIMRDEGRELVLRYNRATLLE
jgi:hypothetical protein